MQRSIPGWRRVAVALLFATGCGGGSNFTPDKFRLDFSLGPDFSRVPVDGGGGDAEGPPADLGEPESDLLVGRVDSGPGEDAAPPVDIAMGVDAAMRPDLAMVVDLAAPIDLARPPDLALAIDLARPADLTPAFCPLKVNELQTEGGTADDEFIEIYNPCNRDVLLTDWKVVYRSVAGVADSNVYIFKGESIKAGGYFLLAGAGYLAGSDIKYAGGKMANSMTGGGIALRDADGNIVDSVGYGVNTVNSFVENQPTAPHAVGKSLQRLPNGKDTNNNFADLRESAPTPRAANF